MARKPSGFASGSAGSKQRKFLTALARCGTVRKATKASKVSRSLVREWQKAFPAFAVAVSDAEADYNDFLREHLIAIGLGQAKGQQKKDNEKSGQKPANPPANWRALDAVLERDARAKGQFGRARGRLGMGEGETWGRFEPGDPAAGADGWSGPKPVPTAAELARWELDPIAFFREALGWEPWSKQIEIAHAVRDAIEGNATTTAPRHSEESSVGADFKSAREDADATRPSTSGDAVPAGHETLGREAQGDKHLKRIAVRAANGVGKTALAARLMLWVLRCHPKSVVITTAPTQRQVEQLLWREARAAYQGAKVHLGGKMYERSPHWNLGPRHYALGVSPEKTQTERFQGFHAPLIVFIVDEASAVGEKQWEAIKGSLLAGNAVLLAIGNPLRTTGEFYDAFHAHSDLWRTMHVSAFDVPGIADEENATTTAQRHGEESSVGADFKSARDATSSTTPRAAIPGLVTKDAVAQAKTDWGDHSTVYAIRVEGAFPKQASNQLLSMEWLEKAVALWKSPPSPVGADLKSARHAPQAIGALPKDAPCLGVDVARSGSDATALALLVADRLECLETFHGQDTMKTAEVVQRYHVAHEKRITIAIDDGGVGGGVVDRLRQLNISVHAVKFGGAPEGRKKEHFANKLSEMYWLLHERLRDGRLALPDDKRLLAQLAQIDYEVESDRAIRVHKRGLAEQHPSPDRADALVLAIEAQARATRGTGVWL
ncbi:MAG: hypothetical protein HY261_03285 [Chloroflexi bacterium]|nr:hypothetical protein [Chloroflexota bacterium]